MLKIYNAIGANGDIILDDYISFYNNKFDTGIDGYGTVLSGNNKCLKANYELQHLKGYLDYLNRIEQIDGFINNYVMINPVDYKMLENITYTTEKDFINKGLEEEAVLLFTNRVYVENINPKLVKRVFGRYPGTAMYLVKPNASMYLSTDFYGDRNDEYYELLQSNTKGKQLVLEKLNRKI